MSIEKLINPKYPIFSIKHEKHLMKNIKMKNYRDEKAFKLRYQKFLVY